MKQNVFSPGLGAAILNQRNCAKFGSPTNLTTVVSKTAVSFLTYVPTFTFLFLAFRFIWLYLFALT